MPKQFFLDDAHNITKNPRLYRLLGDLAHRPNIKAHATAALPKSGGMTAMSVLNYFHALGGFKNHRAGVLESNLLFTKKRNDVGSFPEYLEQVLNELEAGVKPNRKWYARCICVISALYLYRKLVNTKEGQKLNFREYVVALKRDIEKNSAKKLIADLKLILPATWSQANIDTLINGTTDVTQSIKSNLEEITRTANYKSNFWLHYRYLINKFAEIFRLKMLFGMEDKRYGARLAEGCLTQETKYDFAAHQFSTPTTNTKRAKAWVKHLYDCDYFSIVYGKKGKVAGKIPIGTSPVTLSVGVGGGKRKEIVVQCIQKRHHYNLILSKALLASVDVSVDIADAVGVGLGLEGAIGQGFVFTFFGNDSQAQLIWFIARLLAGDRQGRNTFQQLLENELKPVGESIAVLHRKQMAAVLKASVKFPLDIPAIEINFGAELNLRVEGSRVVIVGVNRREENLDLFIKGRAAAEASVNINLLEGDDETEVKPTERAQAGAGEAAAASGKAEVAESDESNVEKYFDSKILQSLTDVGLSVEADITSVKGIGRRYIYLKPAHGQVSVEADFKYKLRYETTATASLRATVNFSHFSKELGRDTKFIKGKKYLRAKETGKSWGLEQELPIQLVTATSDKSKGLSLFGFFSYQRTNIIEVGNNADIVDEHHHYKRRVAGARTAGGPGAGAGQ